MLLKFCCSFIDYAYFCDLSFWWFVMTDLSVKRKIEKHREKVLRCDSVLQKNPFVQALPSSKPKQKKKSKKENKDVVKEKDETRDGQKVSNYCWILVSFDTWIQTNFVLFRFIISEWWCICFWHGWLMGKRRWRRQPEKGKLLLLTIWNFECNYNHLWMPV